MAVPLFSSVATDTSGRLVSMSGDRYEGPPLEKIVATHTEGRHKVVQ
ncbi:MAG TPA: hypothetical protein VKA50_11375 [Gammaproteobacteria bacterium]|nr:hypothetical protein [Gammaproteobacteria bacterium]